MKMSAHASNDRADRLTYIALNVGFGNIIYEFKTDRHTRECITDTGVLLVMAENDDTLITAYVLDMDKAIALFRQGGYARIPEKMYSKIRNNHSHVKKQNQVVY